MLSNLPFDYYKMDESGHVGCQHWMDELARLLEHGIVKTYYNENMPWSYGLGLRLCTRSGWLVISTTEDGLLAPHERAHTSTLTGTDITTEVIDNDGIYYPHIQGNILAAKNLISKSEWYMVHEDDYESIAANNASRKIEWSSWHHDKVWQALKEHPKMVSLDRIKWMIGTTPNKKRKRKKVSARPIVLQAQLDLPWKPPGPWFDLQLWHQAEDDYDLLSQLVEIQSKTTGGFIHTSTESWKRVWSDARFAYLDRELKRLVVSCKNSALSDRIVDRSRDTFDRYHLRIVRRPAIKDHLVDNRCDDLSGSYPEHRLNIEDFEHLPKLKKKTVRRKKKAHPKTRRKVRR